MAGNLDPGARAAAEQKARKAARDAARQDESLETSKTTAGKSEIIPPWEMDAAGIALVDTHAHIDGEDFDGDREEMLARAKQAGVVAVIALSLIHI